MTRAALVHLELLFPACEPRKTLVGPRCRALALHTRTRVVRPGAKSSSKRAPDDALRALGVGGQRSAQRQARGGHRGEDGGGGLAKTCAESAGSTRTHLTHSQRHACTPSCPCDLPPLLPQELRSKFVTQRGRAPLERTRTCLPAGYVLLLVAVVRPREDAALLRRRAARGAARHSQRDRSAREPRRTPRAPIAQRDAPRWGSAARCLLALRGVGGGAHSCPLKVACEWRTERERRELCWASVLGRRVLCLGRVCLCARWAAACCCGVGVLVAARMEGGLRSASGSRAADRCYLQEWRVRWVLEHAAHAV